MLLRQVKKTASEIRQEQLERKWLKQPVKFPSLRGPIPAVVKVVSEKTGLAMVQTEKGDYWHIDIARLVLMPPDVPETAPVTKPVAVPVSLPRWRRLLNFVTAH